MTNKKKIVTIDGPAGAGKSTVAKALAKKLNFSYLDTGAMYRALTLKALRLKIDLKDEQKLTDLALKTKVNFRSDNDEMNILLDGEDVSQEIRKTDVTENTFYVAQLAGVRKVLVSWQQNFANEHNTVIEGRDTGTVVFPQAQYKFYLDADLNMRGKRRSLELKDKGQSVDEKTLTNQIKERDQKDQTRKESPLKKADDAIVIDTTHLTVDQTAEKMLGYIHGQKINS